MNKQFSQDSESEIQTTSLPHSIGPLEAGTFVNLDRIVKVKSEPLFWACFGSFVVPLDSSSSWWSYVGWSTWWTVPVGSNMLSPCFLVCPSLASIARFGHMSSDNEQQYITFANLMVRTCNFSLECSTSFGPLFLDTSEILSHYIVIPISRLNATHRYRPSALFLRSASRPKQCKWWPTFLAVEIRLQNDASMLRVVIIWFPHGTVTRGARYNLPKRYHKVFFVLQLSADIPEFTSYLTARDSVSTPNQ